MSLIGDTVIYV